MKACAEQISESISPLKKFFGSEENKDLLISLINAILEKEPDIVDLTLKNPYNFAEYQAGKMSILEAMDPNRHL